MKISKTKLNQIIKEELQRVLSEGDDGLPPGAGSTKYAVGRIPTEPRAPRKADWDKTAAFTAADIEQREKSDAAAVAKDPILNGRKLKKLFFGSKDAKRRLKLAQSEMVRPTKQEKYVDEEGKERTRSVQWPDYPKTAQEKYEAESRAYDRLERKYHKMKGNEDDFGDAKSDVLAAEGELEELANKVQPHYDVIDLHTQLKGGYRGFIDVANDMIQELGLEKMKSLVVNPSLLRSFFEKFEASRVDPVKKSFAAGEFPR
jgi:hypothetical protein